MNTKLSKSEVKALRQLCREGGNAGQVAHSLGMKNSFTSRILARLKEKGLIDVKTEGSQKIIQLSVASHAQNFKQLSDSRPEAKIEKWLSGYAMDILIVSVGGATTELVLKESGCSHATFYKTLKSLAGAGILFWKNGRVEITDMLVDNFVSAYADNLQLIIQRGAKGLNTSIRVRKHVVLRTDAAPVPPFFTKTGLNALAEKGMEATMTSYKDYYFNLDQKKKNVGTEEAFIHALLLTTLQQHQDMPVLTIFFAQNRRRLDLRALKEYAKLYLVEGAIDDIRQKTEFYEKMKNMTITEIYKR